MPCRRLLAFQLADPCTPCFLGGVNETACAVMRPNTSRCASGESQNINSKFRPWLVANTRCCATRVMQSARPSRILALRGRTIVLARLLRRTECKTQLVPPTAAPNHHPNPLSFSAVLNRGPGPEAKSVARKRCRRRVRVEGLHTHMLRHPFDAVPERLQKAAMDPGVARLSAYRVLSEFTLWSPQSAKHPLGPSSFSSLVHWR